MRAPGAVAALAACAVVAQGGQPPERVPVFPAGAEWVTVDAVVLDRSGAPLAGLRAEDFTLEEDGVRQAIGAFEAIETAAGSSVAVAAERAVPDLPLAGLPPAGVTRAGRVFVIVFDDLHLDAAEASRAREAVAGFLDGLAGGDRVTLVVPGRDAWWHACVPEGASTVRALLPRLAGRARTGERPGEWMGDQEALRIRDGDPLVLAYVVRRWRSVATDVLSHREPDTVTDRVRDAANRIAFDVQRRTRATLEVVARALAALSRVSGRKSVVLVSSGFPRDEAVPEFAAVVAEARRANAAVYFVDARGLAAVGPHLLPDAGAPTDLQDVSLAQGALDAASEGSESLAADTGGFSIRKRNDLARGLGAIARESTIYYLLGYAAPQARRSGFRRIEVRVARDGVRVRARRGYYPAGAGPARPADADVQRALDSPFAAGGIALRAASFVLGETRGKIRVLLTTDLDLRGVAPLDKPGPAACTLAYVLAIFDGAAGALRRSSETLAVRRAADEGQPGAGWISVTRETALAPGRYQARFVAREAASGRIGSLLHEFVVPETGGLRVSTPILSDRRPGGTGDGLEPIARRTFAPSGVLHGRFEVYGAARGASGRRSVRAGFAVQHADGRWLAAAGATPLVPAADGTLGRTFGVPLDGAAAGRYTLTVAVEDETSGGRAEARETFFVDGAAES